MGNFRAAYRIWTCFGSLESGNNVQGRLAISRKREGKGQTLAFEQVLFEVGKTRFSIRVRVRCRMDSLASPFQWTRKVSIRGADGVDYAYADEGSVRGKKVEIQGKGPPLLLERRGPLTDEWCLFEALQRAPLTKEGFPVFSVMKAFSTPRGGQALRYTGGFRVSWAGEEVRLHRFDRTGPGGLPWEYWLDESHRLVLAVTGPRVYVLDPSLFPEGGKR